MYDKRDALTALSLQNSNTKRSFPAGFRKVQRPQIFDVVNISYSFLNKPVLLSSYCPVDLNYSLLKIEITSSFKFVRNNIILSTSKNYSFPMMGVQGQEVHILITYVFNRRTGLCGIWRALLWSSVDHVPSQNPTFHARELRHQST